MSKSIKCSFCRRTFNSYRKGKKLRFCSHGCASRARWADLTYSEKTKRSMKKIFAGRDARRLKSEITRELWQNPAYRSKILIKLRKISKRLSYRRKMSLAVKASWLGAEKRRKQFADSIRKHQIWKSNPDAVAESNRRRWALKTLQEKRKWSKNTRRVCGGLRPNNLEKKLSSILRKLKLPYRYVGDGKFWVEHRNPDFVNTNGQKKVIEVFGRYWHPPQDESKCRESFREYGFECLVIWDYEIKNCESKLLEFEKC